MILSADLLKFVRPRIHNSTEDVKQEKTSMFFGVILFIFLFNWNTNTHAFEQHKIIQLL